MPLIRKRSGARAGARAMVTGQIVDTVTNIKTVKLFAHNDHEDRAALSAMHTFRKSSLDYGTVAAWFRFSLNGLAGVLPVIMVGGSLWFWNTGNISAGDIAAAGAISLRLSQMTGWVSYTLMTLYTNLGEVEDGMKTLSPPHTLTDMPMAKSLNIISGKIDFNQISFTYGHDSGAINNISLSINGEKKQSASINMMVWGIEELISILSQKVILKPGDILFTGTPAGVGNIKKGDILEASIDEVGALKLNFE